MDEQAGLIYYIGEAYIAVPNTIQGLRLFRRLSDGLYYIKKSDNTLELFSVGLNMSYAVFQDVVSVNNVGAGEDTLYDNTILANTLAIVGSSIKAHYALKMAAAANAKTIRLYFAGVKIFESAVDFSATGLKYLDLNVEIIRTDVDHARAVVSYTGSGISEANAAIVTPVDYTIDNKITLTAEAVADSDVIALFGKGIYLPNT